MPRTKKFGPLTKAVTVSRQAKRKRRNLVRRAKRKAGGTTIVNIGKPPVVKKEGNYITDLFRGAGKALSYSGEESNGAVNRAVRAGASALGSHFFGSAAGNYIGNAASYFAKLLGAGNYGSSAMRSIRGNTLLKGNDSGFTTNTMPMFDNGSGGSITLTHKEYVADVLSSTIFQTTTYYNNPGNSTLFPWLSQLAALYEEFYIMGMVYEYKPTSAAAVGTTNSAMGVVVMATDYDVADVTFLTKQSMEAAEYSTSGVPFDCQVHPIECARSRTPFISYYVSNANTPTGLPAGVSMHEYFPSATTIATVGQQSSGQAIGELWVTYHVVLMKPILELNSSFSFAQHISGTIGTSGAVTQISNHSNGTPYTISYGTATAVLQPSAQHVGSTYLFLARTTQSSNSNYTATSPNYFIASGPGIVLDNNSVTNTGTNTAPATDGVIYNNSGPAGRTCGTAIWGIYSIVNTLNNLSVNLPYISGQTTGFEIFITPYNITVSLSRDVIEDRIARLEQQLAMQLASQPAAPSTAPLVTSHFASSSSSSENTTPSPVVISHDDYNRLININKR